MGDPKILKLSWIFFMIYLVNSSPPEDPIKCSSKTNFNCTITNSYGAFPDRATCKAAQAVFPTTEEEVISVVANATREKRKMKVATRFSHSIPKLVCPDGEDGLLISTKFLNKILRVDQENMTITVESGVTLRQLISEAAKAGLVLPYTPYWWGLTIGGLIGTGAHGSSLWGLGSSVHDYIVQLRIVTPAEAANNYAKVRTLENGNPDLNAVRVSLGVLGVISQVRLAFTGYPVVGLHNRVQASGTCLDSLEDARITSCPWDPRVKGLFFHQTTFSISLSKVKGFIEDVQRLVVIEPRALCVLDLYDGIVIRYLTTSNAYLGEQEDALDFDITYYRSKDPMSPRLFEDFTEEVEQLAFFKYGALPHWGKNRNIAFTGAIKKYKNADKFLKVKQSYDKLELFSSEWTDQVLGLKDGLNIIKEGCALEGLCICSEDIHCAPKKGYFCRPGKIYKDARVCTRLPSR
ncbi:unnamed protein product [Withania somnifera]